MVQLWQNSTPKIDLFYTISSQNYADSLWELSVYKEPSVCEQESFTNS